MFEELQRLIDEAGFDDVRLVDIPKNTKAPDSLQTVIDGVQLMSFKKPSYGESLLFAVVQARQEELHAQYVKMYRTLIQVIKKADTDGLFDDDAAVGKLIERMVTDTTQLSEDELMLIAKSDISDTMQDIKRSPEVRKALGGMRRLQNNLLIWFCTTRTSLANDVWDMSRVYGMDPDDLAKLKDFMVAELNPASDTKTSGEETGK